MKGKMKIFYLLLLVTVGFCPFWGITQKAVSIGVISDFEASDDRFSSLNKLIVDEIKKTVGAKFELNVGRKLTYIIGVRPTTIHGRSPV